MEQKDRIPKFVIDKIYESKVTTDVNGVQTAVEFDKKVVIMP